ncbi:MAG: hypothetical protein MI974_09120 [Chitinophagales bacterium]|nr:hypothetical protein [Chitinophagales bacterium]
MDENLSFLLADISSFFGLIPASIAFYRIKTAIRAQRLLSILVWGGTCISLAAFALGFFWGAPNLYLLHIYTIFDFILLTFIFKPVLNQKMVNALLIIFPLFAAVNSIFFEQLITFNVLNRSISSFLIMLFALSFFTKALKEMKILQLEKTPLFWISIGALFYNAASFFIFLFSKDLVPFKNLWFTYFGVHSIFTILLYIFYSIALWIRPEKPSTYHSS